MVKVRALVALFTVLVLTGGLFATGAEAQGNGNGSSEVEVEVDQDGRVNGNNGIQIRTKRTAAVVEGDTAWVTVSIRGRADLEDVRFTATLDGETVEYPTNTVDHSGPYNGTGLKEHETDYVAFRVTAPSAGQDGRMAALVLSVTWTENGITLSDTHTLEVPVVAFTGEPYELVTNEVTAPEAANGWVSLGLTGMAPRVENVQVSIAQPEDLDLYYPAETFTSLHKDAVLEKGETDEARLRIGESHWGDTLTVEVQIDYTVEGTPGSRTHSVTVTVDPVAVAVEAAESAIDG
jgi:hypothetical protein